MTVWSIGTTLALFWNIRLLHEDVVSGANLAGCIMHKLATRLDGRHGHCVVHQQFGSQTFCLAAVGQQCYLEAWWSKTAPQRLLYCCTLQGTGTLQCTKRRSWRRNDAMLTDCGKWAGTPKFLAYESATCTQPWLETEAWLVLGWCAAMTGSSRAAVSRRNTQRASHV